MRLQILSDLHLEFNEGLAIDVVSGVDALVVPGDICAGIEKGFRYLRHHVDSRIPIVFVAGNHEFYGRDWHEERALARAIAPSYGVTWLDDDTAVIGDVRFIGATLWSDYSIFGADQVEQAMRVAGLSMSDHITIGARSDGAPDRRFAPRDALAAHKRSRSFLAAELAKGWNGPTVVVTHHGPHARSIAPKFAHSLITAAFITDLSTLIEAHQPALWVHGHTHVHFDYEVGATRVVCNPHGYPGEVRRFDPRLVAEV